MTRQLEQYLQTISEDPRASIKLFALGDDFDEKYVDGEDEPSGDVLGPHRKLYCIGRDTEDNGLVRERLRNHLDTRIDELEQFDDISSKWSQPKYCAKFGGMDSLGVETSLAVISQLERKDSVQ
jgi:hypothetical protein